MKHDTEVKKTLADVKTNIDPETKPSSRASLPPSSSYSSHFLPVSLFSLSHSFILSLLSSKVVALFHSLPWARGEQCKHTLLPWIRVRNPIRPSYSPYSFSFFSLFFFSFTLPFCHWKEGGNLNRLAVKAKSSSVLSFLFSRRHLFLLALSLQAQTHTHTHTLAYTSFPCASVDVPPIVTLSINRKGQKRWEWKKTPPNKRHHNWL